MNLIRDERGQATAEYALVMVAAATVALALILWASTSGVLPDLFDAVIARIFRPMGRVDGIHRQEGGAGHEEGSPIKEPSPCDEVEPRLLHD